MHQSLSVYCLVPKFSMYEETKNSYLELIDDFEVPREIGRERVALSLQRWIVVVGPV
jgi:hypothetical protein